ncbi:MAG: N-acetylmuramoyl-L-alanine amidase [Gaiellaceae bacterium]
MRRAALAAAACALVAPAPAAATPWPAGVGFSPANPRNFAHAHRPASAISLVVVHVVEGSYGGAISWFRNPRARASANYVVSRGGEVMQMVPEWDVAWHAGNGWVNAHSLGIEHEGYTSVPAIFTDAEYRASARLVAAIVQRFHIPVDRRHLIGHNQVPDPFHRGRLGGWGHHTDPGTTWNWARYLAYVRSYVQGVEPPPLPFDVTIPGIALAARLRGTIDWSADPVGEAAQRVDFLVDGALRSTIVAEPYTIPWDTTAEANGRHVLTVHAVGADGRTSDAAVVVKIANPPLPPKVVTQTLADGQTVSGLVAWSVTTSGRVDHVEYSVDGLFRDAEFDPPYTFAWDTTQETPGLHTLGVRAVTPDGRPGLRTTIQVVVANP